MYDIQFGRPNLSALKGSFVADMHFHTQYSHDCSTPVADILKLARKLGVHVAITDHNRIGGVLAALKEKDAPIIPSIEICSKEGKEVIPYFYDAGHLQEFYERRLSKFLKDKNALRSSQTSIGLNELLDMLSEEECVVSLPHPFAPKPRQSYTHFSGRHDLSARADVVEVFNASMARRANLAALGWAVQLQRGIVGGSDGHQLKRLGIGVTASAATSVSEHLDLLAKGAVRVYGEELRAHERVIDFASTSVRVKIQNGVTGGLRKSISFPVRASKRLIEISQR